MVNKLYFENHKIELQVRIGSKISEAINKLNEKMSVKLENNKYEIIQSLKNGVSLLQNPVGKLESLFCLFQDALINNETKISNSDQYSRWNNVVIQGIPHSVKYKDFKDTVINFLDKVKVKDTKKDIEVCHRLGNSRKSKIN